MGTHPKSPSLMLASKETLTSYLSKNQYLIGERVSQKFGTEEGNLPYLFKVLAIEKALSIQSHPDKATAEKLHAQQPDVYKGKPTPAALWVRDRSLFPQIRTTNPKWRSLSRLSLPFAAFSRCHASSRTSTKYPN